MHSKHAVTRETKVILHEGDVSAALSVQQASAKPGKENKENKKRRKKAGGLLCNYPCTITLAKQLAIFLHFLLVLAVSKA